MQTMSRSKTSAQFPSLPSDALKSCLQFLDPVDWLPVFGCCTALRSRRNLVIACVSMKSSAVAQNPTNEAVLNAWKRTVLVAAFVGIRSDTLVRELVQSLATVAVWQFRVHVMNLLQVALQHIMSFATKRT